MSMSNSLNSNIFNLKHPFVQHVSLDVVSVDIFILHIFIYLFILH